MLHLDLTPNLRYIHILTADHYPLRMHDYDLIQSEVSFPQARETLHTAYDAH